MSRGSVGGEELKEKVAGGVYSVCDVGNCTLHCLLLMLLEENGMERSMLAP